MLRTEQTECDMAKSGYKGISRINQSRKHAAGWYVRVRLGSTTLSKFVRDDAHGGRAEALQMAVETRNQLEIKLGKPRTDNIIVVDSPRNKTGVIGIQRKWKATHRHGKKYLHDVFEVTWNAGREMMGKTSVSINKYGEVGAFRRACAIRRQKEKKMYGETVAAKWVASLSKVCAA